MPCSLFPFLSLCLSLPLSSLLSLSHCLSLRCWHCAPVRNSWMTPHFPKMLKAGHVESSRPVEEEALVSRHPRVKYFYVRRYGAFKCSVLYYYPVPDCGGVYLNGYKRCTIIHIRCGSCCWKNDATFVTHYIQLV